jgi:DNA-binding CsgD family transcriptional regulator
LEQSIAAFREIGDPLFWYLGGLGVCYLLRGNVPAAREVFDELSAFVDGIPAGSAAELEVVEPLLRMAILFDDLPQIARLYPRLVPHAGRFANFPASRTLGEAAIRLGDFQSAERYLHEAETAARNHSVFAEIARTLEARAALATARGERQSADALQREALAVFEAIGWSRDAERLRGALGPARPTLPAGLSAREAEVLRLVAAGQSNREIAEALVISEKTVTNHLTSIFNKTGATNRAGAAAFAIRQGLA